MPSQANTTQVAARPAIHQTVPWSGPTIPCGATTDRTHPAHTPKPCPSEGCGLLLRVAGLREENGERVVVAVELEVLADQLVDDGIFPGQVRPWPKLGVLIYTTLVHPRPGICRCI